MKATNLREIPGFANYFADTEGNIWTCKRKGGNDRGAGRIGLPRRLKCHQNGSGYMVVNLDVNGRVFSRLVHRLILQTFVGPAPVGHQACHYPDKNPMNNRLENLRWGTQAENARDKFRDRLPVLNKVCRPCGKNKSRAEFYTDKRASDGLQSECKTCHNRISVATRNPDKKRKANRDFMRRKRLESPHYSR